MFPHLFYARKQFRKQTTAFVFRKRALDIVALLAFLLPIVFLSSTIATELSGSLPAIAAVKRGIAYSLLLLVPAMAVTGLSGNRLGGRSRARPVVLKRKRMKVIALNGILVLVPCAVTLHALASTGSFGWTFISIKIVEIAAGAVNVALLGLSFRDGLRLSGRLSQRTVSSA